jgi:hydrogenase nickel incorporation protein HypA/HybF
VHELSIADAIIQTALRCARGRRVARIELKVGHLRQVVPSALTFGFELVAVGTPAEGAELDIEAVPARVSCLRCAAESVVSEFPLWCASCNSLHVEVIAGDELFVEALELEDEQVPLQVLGKGR